MQRLAIIIGLLCIALGVACNEYTLTCFFAGHGIFDSPRLMPAVWVFDTVVVAWGLVTLLFHKRRSLVRANIIIALILLTFPIAAELMIRLAIAMNNVSFRQPHLYADYYSDEDWYRLRKQWYPRQKRKSLNPPIVIKEKHSLLGWSIEKTEENPLGIITEDPYVPDYEAPAVLFYGCSFTEGVTPVPERIPQQLDILLPEYTVYNYGIAGYGLDQIYLRFKQSHPYFRNPSIIISMLTTDIDRCILRYRDAPKPYFIVERDKLRLKGVPIDTHPGNLARWDYLTPRSYFFSHLFQRLYWYTNGRDIIEGTYRQPEKKAISSRIIEATAQEARNRNIPLLFVIFYGPSELARTGWREHYLHEQLKQRRIPFVDTKEVLIAGFYQSNRVDKHRPLMPQHYRAMVTTYYTADCHPNAAANKLIAEAISKHFID